MMKAKIAVLPGDGIGKDVTDAVMPVFDLLDSQIECLVGAIGWECWCADGDPVPPATWDLISRTDAALVGAVTSKPEREARAELNPSLDPDAFRYVSPVVQLRQRLSLSANLRPVADLRSDAFDFIVVRENTEGLYAGFDEYPVGDAVWSAVAGHPNARDAGQFGAAATIRLQTRSGVEAVLGRAMRLASARSGRVTVADKPNVLRSSSELLRDVVDDLSRYYPNVEVEILNVDAVGMWIVTRPERFDVIVAENMFGDILSDVGAGVMGGLGLASSANIGNIHAYFEPVHGSAPHLAGTGRANPMAMFLTVASLLEHLDATRDARRVRHAVKAVYRAGEVLTYDLGGTATTTEVAGAILDAVARGER